MKFINYDEFNSRLYFFWRVAKVCSCIHNTVVSRIRSLAVKVASMKIFCGTISSVYIGPFNAGLELFRWSLFQNVAL